MYEPLPSTSSNRSRNYVKSISLAREFARLMELPAKADVIIHDLSGRMWDHLPISLHNPGIFSDIIVFHAIKTAGIIFDPVAFCTRSKIKGKLMIERRWLLRYTRYLPKDLIIPKKKVSENEMNEFLGKLGDTQLELAARQYMEEKKCLLSNVKPRLRAGISVLVVMKSKEHNEPIARKLKQMGLLPGTVYNAAKRIGLKKLQHDPKIMEARQKHGDLGEAVA